MATEPKRVEERFFPCKNHECVEENNWKLECTWTMSWRKDKRWNREKDVDRSRQTVVDPVALDSIWLSTAEDLRAVCFFLIVVTYLFMAVLSLLLCAGFF